MKLPSAQVRRFAASKLARMALATRVLVCFLLFQLLLFLVRSEAADLVKWDIGTSVAVASGTSNGMPGLGTGMVAASSITLTNCSHWGHILTFDI